VIQYSVYELLEVLAHGGRTPPVEFATASTTCPENSTTGNQPKPSTMNSVATTDRACAGSNQPEQEAQPQMVLATPEGSQSGVASTVTPADQLDEI
jgi:hypothetical protein